METVEKSQVGVGSDEITAWLTAWNEGDEEALSRLVPLVYDQLCAIASNQLRRERRDHTLDTPAVVHETYLRLVRQERMRWRDRTHFYRVTARLIRRVLVDHARHRMAAKCGGGHHHLALDEVDDLPVRPDQQLVAVDEALAELAALDRPLARVVELRFFGGLSIAETAGVLEMSERAVSRNWQTAKAWLYDFLNGG